MRKGTLIGLGAATLFVVAAPAAAQDWRTTTIMRQATTEQSLEVDLGYGAGELRIEPAEGRMLYQASVRYDANDFEPIAEYDDGRLHIGVDNHDELDIPDEEDHDAGRLHLRLGRGVPLDLDLEFGAAMAEIELGGLSVRRLNVATGASETRIRFSEPNPIPLEHLSFDVGAASFTATGLGNTNAREIELNGGVAEMTLDFTGAWRGNTHLDAAFGLGSVTLRVPQDVGVHVHKETLLASFEAPRMSRRGGDDDYYSDNWDRATRRLTVDLDGAFGDITLEWVE